MKTEVNFLVHEINGKPYYIPTNNLHRAVNHYGTSIVTLDEARSQVSEDQVMTVLIDKDPYAAGELIQVVQ